MTDQDHGNDATTEQHGAPFAEPAPIPTPAAPTFAAPSPTAPSPAPPTPAQQIPAPVAPAPLPVPATQPTPYPVAPGAVAAPVMPVTAMVPPAEASAPAAAPVRKRAGVGTWILRIVVVLALLAMAGVSGYLIWVSNEWHQQVDQLTEINTELGQKVADEQSAALTAQANADEAMAQLDELKSRVTDLANEEANATDNQSVLVNYLDAMVECADGRQELIDVLTDSSLYYPGTTNAAVERELRTYCDGVKEQYNALKQELGQ